MIDVDKVFLCPPFWELDDIIAIIQPVSKHCISPCCNPTPTINPARSLVEDT